MYCLNDSNRFNLDIHLWDEAALGYKVSEITDLVYDSRSIFELIDEKNRELEVKLCCSRQSSNDIVAKRDFLNSGFYIAEQSLIMQAELKKIKAKKVFSFKEAEANHLSDLENIAEKEFLFGRFHEDPFVEREKAQLRYKRWIDQLILGNKCLIAEDNNSKHIIGFFTYSITEGKCILQLAGLNSVYRGYGYFFFSSIFDYIKPQVNLIEATISSANIDIINLYSHFGFKVVSSLFGYHKSY